MSNKHKPPQQPPEQAPKPKGLGEYIVSKVEEHGEKKKKKKAEKEAAKAPGTADPIKINESREYTQGFMDEVSKALQIDKTASADDVADILLMIQKRLKHETDDVVRDNLSSALLKIASRRPDAMAVIQNKADKGDKAAKGVLNILIKTDEGATPATLKKFGAYKNKSNWLLSADESMGVIGIIEEGAHKANKTPLTETAKKLGLKLEKIPATYKTGVLIELQARGLATADDLEKLGVIVYDDIINNLRKAGYDDFAMCLGKLMQKGVGESTIDDIMVKAVQGDDMEKIFIAAYGEKTAKKHHEKIKVRQKS